MITFSRNNCTLHSLHRLMIVSTTDNITSSLLYSSSFSRKQDKHLKENIQKNIYKSSNKIFHI